LLLCDGSKRKGMWKRRTYSCQISSPLCSSHRVQNISHQALTSIPLKSQMRPQTTEGWRGGAGGIHSNFRRSNHHLPVIGAEFRTMQGGHQFVVRNYRFERTWFRFCLQLPPRPYSGGPAWTDTDLTTFLRDSGRSAPNLDEQMAMVTKLSITYLTLRSPPNRKTSVYVLTVVKAASISIGTRP